MVDATEFVIIFILCTQSVYSWQKYRAKYCRKFQFITCCSHCRLQIHGNDGKLAIMYTFWFVSGFLSSMWSDKTANNRTIPINTSRLGWIYRHYFQIYNLFHWGFFLTDRLEKISAVGHWCIYTPSSLNHLKLLFNSSAGDRFNTETHVTKRNWM